MGLDYHAILVILCWIFIFNWTFSNHAERESEGKSHTPVDWAGFSLHYYSFAREKIDYICFFVKNLEVRVEVKKIGVTRVSLTSEPQLFQDLLHTVDVKLLHSEYIKIGFLSIKKNSVSYNITEQKSSICCHRIHS